MLCKFERYPTKWNLVSRLRVHLRGYFFYETFRYVLNYLDDSRLHEPIKIEHSVHTVHRRVANIFGVQRISN